MKIHLVIPMAGEGSRFYKEGYKVPKPMVQIHKHPFFYWAIQSVVKFADVQDITCIVLNNHIEEYELDKEILKYYPMANIVALPRVLCGPTLTCLEGSKAINDNLPVLINDCDHMFKASALYEELTGNQLTCDGGLVTFNAKESQYSYVKFDSKGEICGTVEKQVVSMHAICGAYLFRNISVFRNASEEYLRTCEYHEFFLSGIYNVMCKKGAKIKTFPSDFHISFGTPEEYRIAMKAKAFAFMD